MIAVDHLTVSYHLHCLDVARLSGRLVHLQLFAFFGDGLNTVDTNIDSDARIFGL